MVTGTDILNAQNEANQFELKLATVMELFENETAKIRFYGEETDSEKQYSYLASYTPTVNDIVLTAPLSDTYIILGKILYDEISQSPYVTLDNLNLMLQNYATTTAIQNFVTLSAVQGLLTGYAQLHHEHGDLNYGSYKVGFDYIVNNIPQLVPSSSNIGLGASNYKWKEVYANAGEINTSDERQKKDIQIIPDKYLDFLYRLNPVVYKFIDNTSDRFHVGAISQKVKQAMDESGIDSKEFAGYIETPIYDKDNNETGKEYGLRYSEFIFLNIMATQKHEETIKNQQETINNLIDRITKLENMKEGVN